MDVLSKIDSFYNDFKGEKSIIGKSYLNRNIYCFKVGKENPILICQYGIHAREHITSLLCLEHIKYFEKHKKTGTVYFIPTINPDGIHIALNKYPLYKANARGVDLNVNFDARWGTGEKNVFEKGHENYVGKFPFSEKESALLRDFTLSINPDATISYHAKGEEIYYEFFQTGKILNRDYNFALAIQKCTGYKIKRTPNSSGGYKDWCIEKLKIPALTIEVGSDKLTHPILEGQLKSIFNRTKKITKAAIDFLLENK